MAKIQKRVFLKVGIAALLVAGCAAESVSLKKPDPLAKGTTETVFAPTLPSAGTSSETLVRQALARIDAIDRAGPTLQSVLSVNPDALEIAKALDAERAEGNLRGPIHGIPVLLKDNIESKDNLPTTAGSWALIDNKNGRDAPLSASLRKNGAVILGKSNLSQWANFRSEDSVSGWSSVRGQVRNPHSLNRSPCGSSSGSGAAVASGIVAAAIGTETNGSIICPSAMNGIVGFKPTVGVISQELIVPISSTQDTAGPMTLTVTGAAMMMDALTENDGSYVSTLGTVDPGETRIGVLNFAKGSNPGVHANFQAALDDLEEKGFSLVEIEEWEPGEGFWKASYDVLKYEFKATLNEYLASTTGAVKTRSLAELIEFNKNDPREMAVFTQSIFEASEALGGLTTEEYKTGLAMVLKATRENGIDKMMSDNNVDFLMAPSTAPTFLIDHIYGDSYPGGTGAGWVAAIAGYPHITVPMGTHKGLPTGLSFMSTAGADKQVVAMGYAFEQASGELRVKPDFRPSLEQAENGKMLGGND
ncbi:amidase [Hellea balneolensis]|uniref:amidase n=1 Tax=Hellea balneolensis TaxID=287478 RepID=UPI000429D662|nr:amidase [Hellea balneolensis]